MNKEYLCIPLDKMYFVGLDSYKPISKMNKMYLSDGSEVKFFLNYQVKNLLVLIFLKLMRRKY